MLLKTLDLTLNFELVMFFNCDNISNYIQNGFGCLFIVLSSNDKMIIGSKELDIMASI